MVKGDIYFGKKNLDGKHPIVFLDDIDEYSFHGLMLTHSSRSGNEKLEKDDFEWTEKGFDTENTHLVKRSLIKKKEWAPFTKVGKLSELGLTKVASIISGQTPEYW